ncbi:MAG TPA: glycosyltransferase family A protein [Dissulfurispiraceae bacterium]|nr:glycosyltransferase family A protein [Dissulfurispiraceae bacterium]
MSDFADAGKQGCNVMTDFSSAGSSPAGPAVSVVMPLYNKEATVRRAVESVLSQTVTDFELIIVNDGSTDRGPDIARTFDDGRIRIIDQPNAGVSSARNRGIHEAETDLIAFIDADDEWEKDFLETIVSLRQTYPHCGVYGTSYFLCRPGHTRQAVLKGMPGAFVSGVLSDYFLVAAYSDPPLCSSAVAVTRDAITGAGGFPENVSTGEDLLTWARLASRYDIAYTVVPKSSFWMPLKISDRPGRFPQMPDRVGDGLMALKQEHPSARMKGLRDYIALWHRMRAVLYMHLGERVNAVNELRKAFHACGGLKVCMLYAVAIMPARLSAGLLSAMHAGRESFREHSSDGRSAR